MSTRSLLLSSTYEPLKVISWQRAVTLLFLGKVEVIRTYETFIRAPSSALPAPAVVRLTSFVRRRRVRVAMTRRNVFYRDGYTCQYCMRLFPVRELTCDHVVPRSQGGNSSWDNLVAACAPCNRRKGGRTPEEARMRLRRRPSRPESLPVEYTLNLGGTPPPEPWRDFLGWATAIDAA